MNKIVKRIIWVTLSCVMAFAILYFAYQLHYHSRGPNLDGITGWIAMNHMEKVDLDYLKVKKDLYICKPGKTETMLNQEFVSYSIHGDDSEPFSGEGTADATNFKETIVVTKDGRTLVTCIAELCDRTFYLVTLKEIK